MQKSRAPISARSLADRRSAPIVTSALIHCGQSRCYVVDACSTKRSTANVICSPPNQAQLGRYPRRRLCATGRDGRASTMTTDGIVINLEERAKHVGKDVRLVAGGPPSEDAIALAFVGLHGNHYRYVPAWRRWIAWDGKRWVIDHDGAVFALIRAIVREAVGGTKHE